MHFKRMTLSLVVFIAMSTVVAHAITIQDPEGGETIDNNSDIFTHGSSRANAVIGLTVVKRPTGTEEQSDGTTADGHGHWSTTIESPDGGGWTIDDRDEHDEEEDEYHELIAENTNLNAEDKVEFYVEDSQ